MIVGLGNPGPEYTETRHNAGFMVVDGFLQQAASMVRRECRYGGITCQLRYAGRRLLTVQPQSFMNLSGDVVARVGRVYDLRPEEVLVVYDCMDLPLGRIRLRQAGSSGGHNGME